MAVLKAVFLFFWRNPYAAIALILAVGWGALKWQGYQIDGLKLENDRLSVIVKTERAHTGKVVTAFEDKGVKDANRETFKRKAAVDAKGSTDPLRSAYGSVYERAKSRTPETAR